MDTNIMETPASDTVAAPSTTELLATARQVHAAAIENANGARDRAGHAEAAHRQALADRQALLDQASAGDTVDQADLTIAGTRANEIRDAADLAASIAAGAGTGVERAHVAALHAEAAHLRGGYDAAIADRVVLAELVDEAFGQLRQAIENFNQTNLSVGLARSAAHQFETSLPGAARLNGTLASLDAGLRPRAAVPHHVVLKPVRVLFVSMAGGELAEERMTSLAGRERALFGILDPTPAPAQANMATLQPVSGMTGKAASWTPTTLPAALR